MRRLGRNFRRLRKDITNILSLYAPLTHSLVLTKGQGVATFTRATTATLTDFEGLLKTAKAGEAMFEGARRVENLIPSTETGSASLAVASTKTMTLSAGDYVFSMGIGTGTATFSGTGGTTDTLTASATNRKSILKTVTTGTFIVTGSVATLIDLQVEQVTGQSNKNPSEYVSVRVLSAPYHGAGVDGVKYFTTENGNTVSSNVVTEATGSAIPEATLKGARIEVTSTNLCLQSEDFNTSWTKFTGITTINTNVAIAPNGTATADKIVENQSDNLYHFDMINIIDNMQEFSFIRKLNLTKSHIDSYFKIRIQNVNNQIDMVQTPHIHTPPYNFVVFLNDDFEGGELIINNLTIKPQKGQMVYFSWDEPHYVKNVSLGDRYTLVAFLNNAINLNKLESKLI